MSIRVRTLILIAGTTVILLGVLYLIAALLFLGRFEKLERQESLRGLEQARGALDNELGQLSLFDHDWASWDDTYAFIRDGNRGYAEANLMDETFTGAKLNLMIFLERDGRVRFAKAYDWRADKPLPEPSALLRLLTPGSPLEPLTDEDRHTGGVLLLPKAPLLIASHPILTSTSQGPSRGTLIMGRYLDDAEVAELARITRLSLQLGRVDQGALARLPAALRSKLNHDGKAVSPLDGKEIAAYALLRDVYGEPALLLRSTSPREIYHQGIVTIRYLVFSLLGAGLVFCLVVMFLLEAVVLRRLSALSRGVAAVGRSRDFSARLEARGGDELASLGSSINGMLFELQRTVEARQAAEELARKELLLREIHHRVKNNMQVISSLLYLQARQAGDPRLEAILEENRRRIRSMALIHEKLYQSEQTGSVRLAPYLRDLTNNLLIAYGVGAPGVRLELAVGEEMELALDTAILLGLLVGELASNSLKHAFPGGIGGVLRIALEPCGEGAFRLEVGDDGVGLPVGCDPRTSQSMGFKLVRLFAAQLEASLEVERDSGVSFRFLFKPGR